LSFQGELVNTGLISGVQNGVYFGVGAHDDGIVVNQGTISSDSRAVNIDGDGLELVNEGSIVGTGNQRNGTVYVSSATKSPVQFSTPAPFRDVAPEPVTRPGTVCDSLAEQELMGRQRLPVTSSIPE